MWFLPGSVRQLALGLLAASFALATACGDAPADPIVRLTDASGGGGTGPDDPGDPGDSCAPCDSRIECDPGESCVELERGGERFCSRTCGDGMHRCPAGYVCGEAYNVTSLVCVPDSGECGGVIP